MTTPTFGTPDAVTPEPVATPLPLANTPAALPTQTQYPNRAAVRVSVASFISTLGLAAAAVAAAAPIAAKAAEKLLPGTPVGADIVAGAAAVALVAGTINRISNLPAVAALLTRLHLGPVPKSN